MKPTPDADDAEIQHSLFTFEHFSAPIQPRRLFLRRLGKMIALASVLLFAALAIGILGYRITEHMTWIDSFANASMILSGMGPLSPLASRAGKLFAGCYALFSGLAFITFTGIVLAPIVHRFFHRFHLSDDGESRKRR